MISRSWVPNTVSLMNMFMGFFAIEKICDNRFEEAVWWLALALVCDALDGNVARIFNAQSELGKELDSIGDVVSFVLAPALLALRSWQYPLNIWMFASVYFFLGAGAYRLARFNINTAPSIKGYFFGLPTPATAILVVCTSVGLNKIGLNRSFAMSVVFFSWLTILGVLMASNLLYPKITVVRLRQWIWLCVTGGVVLGVTYMLVNPELSLAMTFLVYVLYGFIFQKPIARIAIENADRP